MTRAIFRRLIAWKWQGHNANQDGSTCSKPASSPNDIKENESCSIFQEEKSTSVAVTVVYVAPGAVVSVTCKPQTKINGWKISQILLEESQKVDQINVFWKFPGYSSRIKWTVSKLSLI